jgi:hypothetical protein
MSRRMRLPSLFVIPAGNLRFPPHWSGSTTQFLRHRIVR